MRPAFFVARSVSEGDKNPRLPHQPVTPTEPGHVIAMHRPSLISLIAIPLVGVLLALVLLPGIAGLLEGDFKYLSEQLDEGWNHKNNVTLPQAVGDIYAWSFWRVGLRSEAPDSYEIYELIELIKSSTITGSGWQSYPAPPEPPESLPSIVIQPEHAN